MVTGALLTLWVLVFLELLFILALARQIGRVLMRMGASGANPLPGAEGLRIGEKVQPIVATTTEGVPLSLPLAGRNALVVFLSFSECQACRVLVDALCTFASSEGDHVETVAAPVLHTEADEAYVRKLSQAGVRVVLDASLGSKFKVHSYPYAVFVDEEGIVRAKGLVNTLEHVENLVASVEAASKQLILAEQGGKA